MTIFKKIQRDKLTICSLIDPFITIFIYKILQFFIWTNHCPLLTLLQLTISVIKQTLPNVLRKAAF